MVELDHPIAIDKPIDDSWKLVLDLERLVPCLQGGTVLEKTSPEATKAEIRVKIGPRSMKLSTVTLPEQDVESHRVVVRVKSRKAGGTGHADADPTFTLGDGGGNGHTAAQITGRQPRSARASVSRHFPLLVLASCFGARGRISS